MHLMRRITDIALLLGLVVATRCPAWADQALLGFSNYDTGGAEVQTLGWEFTLNQPVLVTHLGIWDYGADGLNHDHLITIWSTSKVRLVEATVPSGGSPGSQWRWVSVSPTTLGPGTYRIGAVYPIAGPDPDPNQHDRIVGKAQSVTTSAAVTYIRNVYTSGTGYPGSTYSPEEKGYFGPNFRYVPEPAFLQLPTLVGMSAIAFVLRRRREQT